MKKDNIIILIVLIVSILIGVKLKSHLDKKSKPESKVFGTITELDAIISTPIDWKGEIDSIRHQAHVHKYPSAAGAVERTSDLQCPVCGTLSEDTMRHLTARNVEEEINVTFIRRHIQICDQCDNIWATVRDK